MKIVIAGGTGFLGRPLAAFLAQRGHTTVALSRTATGGAPRAQPRTAVWTPDGSTGAWAAEIDGADAVVNLAGESIAARRWTAAQKERILSSRLLATRSLVAAIQRSATPPPIFISGSAVGYYGHRANEVVTEDTPSGDDFLADVARQWEGAAQQATGPRTRVVSIRTGIVLERDGGALQKMLPPFWFGAGGPIGTGRQYWPWIHRQDWIRLVHFAIETEGVSGPLNATAPNPVTNREFASALGRAMRRPAFMPTPGFVLKVMLGEMADALLLSGQRAVPATAVRLGFTFAYPRLESALEVLFSGQDGVARGSVP